MVKIGDPVTYVDTVGKPHNALVTHVFSPDERLMDEKYAKSIGMEKPMAEEDFLAALSINVVIVCDDPLKTDTYGNQIERHTSVVHKDRQTAHGFYWVEAA
jgi:hypothetical protein